MRASAMPHPEVALHPIYGPDGATVLPVGHPMYRASDEVLPDSWPREFVDEMVAGGLAATPDSEAATALAADREAAGGTPRIVVTGMAG